MNIPKLKVAAHSAIAAAVGGALAAAAQRVVNGDMHGAPTAALVGAMLAVAGLITKSPVPWSSDTETSAGCARPSVPTDKAGLKQAGYR